MWIASPPQVRTAATRSSLDTAARSNPVAERKTFRGVIGVEGLIPALGFDYEVAYVYGRTDADITSRVRLEDRYFAAIDAVIDPATGNIVCRSEIDPDATVPPSSPFPAQNDTFGITTFQPGEGQCVPVNIFGFNSISPEAADFIFQPETSTNDIEQQVFTATIAGDTEQWFSLPAGPISFAGGYEWREESSAFQPGGFSAAGLTFGTIASNGGTRCASSSTINASAPSSPAWTGRIPGDTRKPRNRRREPIMSTVPTTTAGHDGSSSQRRLSASWPRRVLTASPPPSAIPIRSRHAEPRLLSFAASFCASALA